MPSLAPTPRPGQEVGAPLTLLEPLAQQAPQSMVLPRVARGEGAAVQECIDRYGGLVWSLAKPMLRNAAEAEDAVQEIFIEIWRCAERFDPARGSEATFIATVARRRLLDRLRRKSRQPATAELLEETVVSAEDPAPLQTLANSEEAERAVEVLAKLAPEQRRAVELSILHGLTQQQIADTLELPLGTVKTHVRRGLMRMREMLSTTATSGGELS